MTTTHAQIDPLVAEARTKLDDAADLEATRQWYREYLGDHGAVSGLTRLIGTLPREERAAFGQAVNTAKAALGELLAVKQSALETVALNARIAEETLDVTMPGRPVARGFLHPTTRIVREICEVFNKMGFQTVEGPEVEFAKYNFDMLNIPADHPARDVWDTFIVDTQGRSGDRAAHTYIADAGAHDARSATARARSSARAMLPL